MRLKTWGSHPRNRKRHGLKSAQPVGDARLAQIVGRHFQPDPIAHSETDEMFSHFSGEMCQHFVLVVQFNAEHGPRKDGRNGAFELNGFFTTHAVVIKPARAQSARRDAAPRTYPRPAPTSGRGDRFRYAVSLSTNYLFPRNCQGKFTTGDLPCLEDRKPSKSFKPLIFR